jgi:hypothetical protein
MRATRAERGRQPAARSSRVSPSTSPDLHHFPDADDQAVVYIETAAGGLFLEEDTEIRLYTLMFEHLRAAAPGLGATTAMLRAIAAET